MDRFSMASCRQHGAWRQQITHPIVQEHDGTRIKHGHHLCDDGVRLSLLPVPAVSGPQHRDQVTSREPSKQWPGHLAAWRPEVAHWDTAQVSQQFLCPLNLQGPVGFGKRRQLRVVPCVPTQGVALSHDLGYQRAIPVNLSPTHEEGRPDIGGGKGVEHGRGRHRIRAIVEGQRDGDASVALT